MSTPKPAPAKVTTSYKEHTEPRAVHWIRDLELGVQSSRESVKLVFCLFQAIPGCSSCTNFGTQVLSDRAHL